MNKFNILSGCVYSPGFDINKVSELKPKKGELLTYKEASKMLGIKGLRYKDEATLIALVTAHFILDQAPELSPEECLNTAVIVTSNLGNIDTVVENAKLIANEHVDATSAMALPNASSNVIAASIAIVNKLRGPNLMLCNGNQSGLDALQIAQDLMLASRAERVLIVGVEVDNEAVDTLIPSNKMRFHGAAGYLLEKSDLKNKRSESQIQAAITFGENEKSTLKEQEIINVCGDASSVTGVMQVLLAMEYAQKNTSKVLSKNASSWAVHV